MSKVDNDALMLALSPTEIAKIANDEQRGLLFKQLPKGLKEGKIYIYCKKGRSPRYYLSKRQTPDEPFRGKYNISYNESDDALNGTVVGYINVGQFRPIYWLANQRRWGITQQEFENCSIVCDNIDDYINKTFPHKAVVYYLPIKNFRPFLTKCTLEDNIIRYDPTGAVGIIMDQQYIHPANAPGPWLHFNDKLSAIPSIYKREIAYSDLPCTPEIPKLNFECKDTLSSRWNRFLLKLHKIFHKKRGE